MLKEKEATIKYLEETIGTLATSKRETDAKERHSDKTNEVNFLFVFGFEREYRLDDLVSRLVLKETFQRKN